MELTHQQIDELLDRIRDDTGRAVDPARITDLLEQEYALAEAESSLELSRLECDLAQEAYQDARGSYEAASARYANDQHTADLARGRVVTMRRALGVMRTATGYITVEQAREARDQSERTGA